MDFKTETRLSDHQREETACSIQAEDLPEGINDSQFELLRSRKRAGQLEVSEEDKWSKIYQIIFPDDDIIPSPCKTCSSHGDLVVVTALLIDRTSDHDLTYESPNDQSTADGSGVRLLRDLGDHARRELPRLMRPRLEDMFHRIIEEGFNPDSVVNLAQGVFQQILQTFKTTQASKGPADGSALTMSGANQQDALIQTAWNPPAEILTGNQADLSEPSETVLSQQDFYSIFQDAVIDSLGSLDCSLNDLLPQSFQLEKFSDSGYGSLEPDLAAEFPEDDGEDTGL